MSTSTLPGPAPDRSQTPQTAHVLVVDDKDVVRDFLREVLEMAGHRVSVVGDGAAALAICQKDPPQVVLTDYQMTPFDGRRLLEELRGRNPSTVCVVLTGYGTVERTVELMRLGAFDVLAKPCRATEILATVEKALEHHRALDANQDLRQRLEAQETKRQQVQEKLAMIGKLAAGVAHEINNPLDAVLRCVRLCKERTQADAEASEYLDLAHAGLLRMADIVQSLLTFSRHAAVEQAPQPLEELVEESITGMTLALGEEAPPMRSEVESRVARVPLPRGMHQVLANLLRNAYDAAGSKRPILVRARRDEDRLLIEVVDQGTGIAPDVLPRVFEPFFTTKEPGKGTGLGLPISARLVEKFGGTLRLECPPEGGTIVSVFLPADRYLAPPLLEVS